MIAEIIFNFTELILVRVFLDGYLRVIGRKRDSRIEGDRNDMNIAMVTRNVSPLESFFFVSIRAMATFRLRASG